MNEHYASRGQQVNDARKRMAILPVGAKVHFTEGLSPPWVPTVELQGVCVLPGIPKLFQAMIMGLLAKQSVCPVLQARMHAQQAGLCPHICHDVPLGAAHHPAC